ncbi:MAG: autotransporter domain-containing protein [Candidatus Neptunochlamydia sp.]|nr:autotransporter domain-containing protein [Candidatus Neptunochlamydia sp.]
MTVVKYMIPFIFASSSLFSLTSEWNLDNNGNWAMATPANWMAGVPNAIDDVAQFLAIITAPRTVSLSQATTVGALSFNNNNAYTIDANTLSFQTSTGNAQITIPKGTGSHIISSTVSLTSDLVIDHNVASNVSLSGPVSGAGTLTVQGNNGQIFLSGIVANTYTGLTTINTTLAAAGITLQKSPGITAIARDTLISFGTLTTAAANQFGNSSTVTVNGASATLAIGPFAQTIGHLDYQVGVFTTVAGTMTLTSNNTALTLGNNVTVNPGLIFSGSGSIVMSPFSGSNVTLAGTLDLGTQLHEINVPADVTGLRTTGVVSGVGGGFVKTGPGNFELNGTANNTYSGLTFVNAGIMTLNQRAAIAVPGDVFINGGTLTLAVSDQIADTSTMILQAGTFNMSDCNETIDRLDFIRGAVNGFTGTLTLQSPSTALQMLGGTVLSGGAVAISNATGGVYFASSANGTATIGNIDFTASGKHSLNIEDGAATPDMQIIGVLGGAARANIVKEGPGSLELNGGASNTFGGETIVDGGTLRLNKTGGALAIPTGAGSVTVNRGNLELLGPQQIASNKTVTVYNGGFRLHGNNQTLETLNCSEGLVVQDGGVLTLTSAENALTIGATTINGDVIIQSGGSITSYTTASVMNGTLTLTAQSRLNIYDNPGLLVINSQITGAGGVSKRGTGTLLLLGENNYSGQTIVREGILEGNTSSLPSVVTTVASSGTLIFAQNFNGTFLGALSGGGEMIKQGTRILRFSTPQTVGGITTVADGTLLVNSTFGGAGPLNVNSGGTLGGIGTINKNVTVNGTLTPGDNRIGTITLNGAQTLSAGSVLDIDLTPTTNDMVNITGTIDIQPDSSFGFFPQPAIYIGPLNYTVIQTTGGRTGTFDHVSDPFPLFFGTVTYDANNVYLSISLFPISDLPGLSAKGQKVAHCLDELNPQPGSDLYNVINSLRFVTSVESIEKSLLDMQPSLFASLATIKQENTLYLRNALFSRLESRTRSCMHETGGYCFWGIPLIGVSQENSHGKEVGYNALTPGIAVGVDGWLASNFQCGGSLGYTSSDVHWKKKRGSGRIQGVYAALYGRLGSQVGFLESAAILGYDWYSTQREIHIRGLIPLNRRAKASHYGLEVSGHVKGAFQFPIGKTLLGPYASLDYQYQYEDAFDENGAKSLNLNVSRKHANFMQSEIGMEVTQCFHLARKTLTPHIQVSGFWEKRFNGAKEESSFGGCLIDVYGYYRSRFLVGAGGGFDVKWDLKNAPRASFNYKGKYGLGYQDHSFNLVLSY